MSHRGSWSGSYGFMIAAIGSAVGLGNIWRFPYLAGTSGGSAFVLVYILMSITFGVSLLVAELDFLCNNLLLPIGGVLLCIVVGYIWRVDRAIEEITQNGEHPFFGKEVWGWIIRYIAPVGILAILLGGTGIFDFIERLLN